MDNNRRERRGTGQWTIKKRNGKVVLQSHDKAGTRTKSRGVHSNV